MTTRSIAKISIITALTIVGAYIAIPIPNLPFTMQTFFAMLAAMLLTRHDAVLSQLIYIAMGLIGLPVFAGGGGGIMYIFMPTFGYVVFLPILAFIIGSFKEKNVYLGTFIPVIIMLIFGGVWMFMVTKLYISSNIWKLIFSYIILYIPVEMLKGFLSIVIWKRLKNIL